MTETKRIISLVVEIQNLQEASWIWDNHLGKACNGIWVMGIQEGDFMNDMECDETRVGKETV